MLGVESAQPASQPLAQPAAAPAAPEGGAASGNVASPSAAEGGGGPAAPGGAAPAKGPASAAPAVVTPNAAAPATPAPYQPNFKFKVLDKELEFDEFLKGAIKDAEVEKKVRDLYERAHGLDSVKQDRQTLRSELSQTKEKIAKTDQALETLGNYVRNGDFDSFFENLNIPKQSILQYALELVQREQWTPQQKAQWEASRSAQQQALHYQTENQQLEARQQQLMVQQKEFELGTVLSTPETQGIAQAYDAGMGQPGAFRQYVIRMGQMLEAAGQDVTAAQAVQEAVRHLRAVNPNLGVPGSQAQPAQGAPAIVQPNNKPTIPNIQGRGTSPVRSSVKNLNDLKKLAQDRIAQEG